MNDNEKLSPTYKKYAKYLGKLFWERSNDWDFEKREYVYRYHLIMVNSLTRRWGKGHYMFVVSDLQCEEGSWRQNYNIESARFERALEQKSLVPVDPKNPNPPPTE